MALKKYRMHAALASLLVLGSARAGAAGGASALVQLHVESTGCPVFTFRNRHWVRISRTEVPRLFAVGQDIRARTVPSRGDIVLIKRSGRVYAVGRTCFSGEEKTVSTGTTHPQGHFYAQFGIYQWQETLTVLSSTGPSSSLISNDSWVCPGAGYRRPFATNLEWDVNGCILLGQSDASLSTSSAEFLIGAQAEGNLLWSPTGGTTQLGFGIPFLLRHGNWVNADGTAAVREVTVLFAGVEIQSRFYLGNFAFNPKLGYFPGTTSLLWSLNLSYGF